MSTGSTSAHRSARGAGRRAWFSPGDPMAVHPGRATFVVVESIVAIGGLSGAVQLATGTYAPPVSDLEPLGLTSWKLPAVWLFATTALPAGAAAWWAFRRAPIAAWAVLLASATLALELVVQIPFVGPSILQAVFGAVSVTLAVLARRSVAGGWRPSR